VALSLQRLPEPRQPATGVGMRVSSQGLAQDLILGVETGGYACIRFLKQRPLRAHRDNDQRNSMSPSNHMTTSSARSINSNSMMHTGYLPALCIAILLPRVGASWCNPQRPLSDVVPNTIFNKVSTPLKTTHNQPQSAANGLMITTHGSLSQHSFA